MLAEHIIIRNSERRFLIKTKLSDDVDDGGRCLVTFQYQESRGTLNEIEAVVMKAMSKIASIVSN